MRRNSAILALLVTVGLYYAIQWATDLVTLASLLPFVADPNAIPWLTSIDHHLVQMVLALGCIWYLGDGDWRAWGLNLENLRTSRRWLTRGFFPVLVVFLFLGELLVPVVTKTPPTFAYELTPVNVVGMLVFMGVVSGLSEEILFRGFVQTYLSRYVDGDLPLFGHELPVAGLLAAIIFTVAHIGFTLTPLAIYHLRPTQLVLAFVLGIYYAVVYHDTESLVAPIVAHNVVNGAIITGTFLAAWILGSG